MLIPLDVLDFVGFQLGAEQKFPALIEVIDRRGVDGSIRIYGAKPCQKWSFQKGFHFLFIRERRKLGMFLTHRHPLK
jgi:hypothetical protein